MVEKKPNIIIINPDEMRADCLGHMGNTAAITPFLDELTKKDAVSFSNAVCQNPVCVPSRCSFTTGLYPHVHGHRTMSYLFRENETSVFKELKDAGYHVWMNARNDLVAGQIPGLIKSHASEIYYGGNAPSNPGTVSNLNHNIGKNRYSMFGGKLGLDENGIYYGPDDEDTDAAIECIKNMPKDKPLCLFLGWVNPHPPYQVEEPYYSAIDRSKVPNRIRWEDGSNKPILEELIRENQNLFDCTEEEWTELRSIYLGMCMKVDDMFKKVCDALKEAGEYDNSAIFFLSDHGDYIGDYGLIEKTQNTFEDCLTNVPFLIKPPKGEKVDPGITDSLTELIDLYATVMDYAGVQPTHSHFGYSLKNIIADRKESNREFVCCEGGRLPWEFHCDEFHANGPDGTSKYSPYWARHHAQTDNDAHAKATMIRTHRYKYVSRITKLDEFYDLEKDPNELVNEINNPEYKNEIIELQIKLMRWLQETTDVVPFDYDQRFSFDMIWAKVKKLVPDDHINEVQQKIRNGMNPFMVIQYCKEHFVNK